MAAKPNKETEQQADQMELVSLETIGQGEWAGLQGFPCPLPEFKKSF